MSVEILVKQITQVKAPTRRDGETKLLVEVAVIQKPAPINADEGSAHHVIQVTRGIVILEQSHVFVEPPFGDQRAAECCCKILLNSGSSSTRLPDTRSWRPFSQCNAESNDRPSLHNFNTSPKGDIA